MLLAGRRAAAPAAGLAAAPPAAAARAPRPAARRPWTVGAHPVTRMATRPGGAAAAAAGRRRGVAAAAGAAAAERRAADPLTAVSDTGLPRTAVVGVLGGGQLGRMMALAAGNMGVAVKFLDPADPAPAAVAAQQTVGHFRDAAAIAGFAGGCDVLTVEIEHIDADAMEAAGASTGVDVEPTPATLRTIQDKFRQKQHFAAAGVPVAPFADAPDEAALAAAAERFGFPLMLKSKRLAYDGRGNYVVRCAADLAPGVAALGGYGHGLYAEAWAPFVKELAVMVVRSRDGTVASYPVVETIHKNNVCHVTEAPARVPDAVAAAAAGVAERAVAALDGAGIFGVEMFLLPDGSLSLNEVAPRPHNSGHYTMDGCVTSQFENHLRAVLGWPLGDTGLNVGSCLMLNMLGEADGEPGVAAAHALMAAAYATPGASVHWYDKPGMRAGRKIGHINVVAPDAATGRARLARLDPSAAAALAASDAAAAAAGLAPRAASAAAPAAAAGAGAGAPKVGIIMGSDSDLPTMRAAEDVLREFGVPCELTIVSAHRTPERMMDYARSAHTRGLQVIIAGAGGAAHLPGMVAAMTPLPVVGVPVKPAGAYLDGVDALLSIVQMPKGVPVATVAIGNAANAGLLALRILGSTDPALLQRMLDYQDGMRAMVLGKAAAVEAERRGAA
ncbi:ADE2 [Scenedesmus sp. PABB004]|nr:ADE2 [Scenedesmus sp. PABB004]